MIGVIVFFLLCTGFFIVFGWLVVDYHDKSDGVTAFGALGAITTFIVMCILVDVMIKNDEITQKDMVSAIQQCGGLHNVDYITYGGAAICIKPLVESEVQ